jgi:tetrahydromethanopterin S-methyltransferase subunit B
MSHGHGHINANRIQIQNMRERIDKLEGVIGELVLALKETNPELAIKYTEYVEKAKK